MLGGIRARRTGRADDHQRYSGLPARHVAKPASLVDDLVERDVGKARKHDVHDRAKPSDRRTYRSADEGGFGDGTVNDPLGAEDRRWERGHQDRLRHVRVAESPLATHIQFRGATLSGQPFRYQSKESPEGMILTQRSGSKISVYLLLAIYYRSQGV